MKSIISKILITGAIVTTFGLNLQAHSVRPMLADTGKMGKMSRMSKMDKKADKKMDKKMARGKMAKDTGKMGKM